MRIFDRLWSGHEVLSHTGIHTPGTTWFWRKAANTAARVVADEAAQLFFQSDLNAWNLGDGAGKFGRQIAPQAETWVEWQEPRYQIVNGGSVETLQARYAVLLRTEFNDTGSIIASAAIWALDRGPIYMYPFMLGMSVDKVGNVLDVHPTGWNDEIDVAYGGMEMDDIGPYALRQMMPAFLAIGLMHCRTVCTSSVTTPPKLSKKRGKNGAFAGLDYRRLEISGVVGESLRANRSRGSGLIAQHMVRSHIRKVTTPLFGRDGGMTGDLLIPGHLRGNPTNGVINKEYHVTAEAAG